MTIKTGILSILDFPANPVLVEKVATWIGESGEASLFHINLKVLADLCGAEYAEIIELSIQAVACGVFQMEWIYHCPHCGGIAKESLTIHDASTVDFCGACKVKFNNRLDDNIEVFFSVHPAIRTISPVFQTSYIKQMALSLDEKHRFDWKFDDTLRGVDIIQHPVFRELMGAEVLLGDQSLELMRTTILFTDVRGSTQMYTDLGDSRAFTLIREHFRILFDIIAKHNGIPVKTIGDAVMGSFTNESNALKAALEAQKTLQAAFKNRPEAEKIAVKIGIHTGSTLVVTLNGKLDYFGSAVNTAARIQGTARPDEVVIPAAIFEKPENRKIIGRYTKKVLRSSKTFPGLQESFEIYHIPVE
jgi:class 3 adenylate cyclase